MLYDRTAEMINDQITRELRKLDSIMTDENEKPAIIQRIADLKTILDVPSEMKERQPATAKELVTELIAAFRRR